MNQDPSFIPSQSTYPPFTDFPGYESDMRNLLKRNTGKNITVHLSYPNSVEEKDKIFKGKIHSIVDDFLLLRDSSNQLIVIWLVYMKYIIFNEEIS